MHRSKSNLFLVSGCERAPRARTPLAWLGALALACGGQSPASPPTPAPAGTAPIGGAVGAAGSAGAVPGVGGTGVVAGMGGMPIVGMGGQAAGMGGQTAGSGSLPPSGPNLRVVSVSPAARSLSAPLDSPIQVVFDRPVDQTSVTNTSFWAFGRWSGPVRDGSYTFSPDGMTATLTSPRKWTAGDRVTVVLSRDLKGMDGSNLRSQGYSFQYSTKTAPAPLNFTLAQSVSIRYQPNGRTQSYGGSATDLNGDGFLDLMIVNEVTADLRILMNQGGGTGKFELLKTPVRLDKRASPSETTDFNGDGIVDLVVANLDANNLSILFGVGDGTLRQSQKIDVSVEPRGVAVFDFDGDGDIDIANTNAGGDNMSVLLNDGTGMFPVREGPGFSFFDAGHGMVKARQEFGLFSGDMNEDGILDLVIGARGRLGRGGQVSDAGVVINTGNGDGTFSFGFMGGPMTMPWQLVVGDLNGDGHEDVATANGALGRESRNSATMLLGDGMNQLNMVQTYTKSIRQPFAIDAGDLDGDGDLDIVVSNYSGDWEVLKNDGTGQVGLAQRVAADNPNLSSRGSASCAILMDIDGDEDLDLALIDENEDHVTFMTH